MFRLDVERRPKTRAERHFQNVATSQGRPFEAATNLAVALIIGAFVGRQFGIGWGVLVGVTIGALSEIGSRK